MSRNPILAFAHTAALIAALALQIDAQEKSYDLQIEGLNGKVESIEEFKAAIEISNGVTKEGARSRHRLVKFDETGRKTYEWSKISDMEPAERFYSYDKNIRFTRTLRGGPRGVERHSHSIFRFDTSNNMLIEKVFPGRVEDKRKQAQGYSFRFGPNGCLLEELMLTAENTPLLRREYIYEDGCLLSGMRLGHASGVGRVQTIKYDHELDDKGNWTKQTIENTLADANATVKREVIYRKLEYYR